MSQPPDLYQFTFSHYNEKARWALDYKGIPHRRISLLPGPHMAVIKKVTGGESSQVPVLRDGGEVIAASDAILEHLERTHPTPALFPADGEARRAALALARWFDEEVGPHVRCAFFFDILPDTRYAASCFALGHTPLKRAVYRAGFPATRVLMRRMMAIDDASAEAGRKRLAEALDRVVAEAGPEGYLVGERFSVADLTAASLLMPAVFPPGMEPALPEPESPGMARWRERWADHPGARWVRSVYARHRGRSAALPG